MIAVDGLSLVIVTLVDATDNYMPPANRAFGLPQALFVASACGSRYSVESYRFAPLTLPFWEDRSMLRRRLSIVWVWALSVSAVGTMASAQRPAPGGAAGGPVRNGNAKVEAVLQGALGVKDSSGKFAALVPDAKATVSLTGPADVEFLALGMYLEFTADFDKKAVMQGELAKFSVVEVTTTVTPAFSLDDPAAANADVGKYFVRAKIVKIKDGDITLQAPNAPPIKVKLASACNITAKLMNIGYAQKGDDVVYDGTSIPSPNPAAPATIRCSRIEVTPVQPLTSKKKRPAAKK